MILKLLVNHRNLEKLLKGTFLRSLPLALKLTGRSPSKLRLRDASSYSSCTRRSHTLSISTGRNGTLLQSIGLISSKSRGCSKRACHHTKLVFRFLVLCRISHEGLECSYSAAVTQMIILVEEPSFSVSTRSFWINPLC